MSVRRVALLIDTSRAYGREVLRGIWRYLQEHGRWSILFRLASYIEPLPDWLTHWDGDGLMLYVKDESVARLIRRRNLCAIDLLGDVPCHCPYVGTDHQRIGEMAADHLLDRGLPHLAACGLRPGLRPGLDIRVDAFQQVVEAAGRRCSVFRPRGGVSLSWEKEQRQIARWIAGLPKPLGVFTCNDSRGREVLSACEELGLLVPDDVAVLGAGNEDLLCDLTDARLSSIDVDSQRVGYVAAALLERMMAGKPAPAQMLIPPRYVVARRSTDLVAVRDPAVSAALRFIRQRACDPIGVADVVARTSVGRRALERRFRAQVGRTLKAEITRLRLERAKELLVETNLSCERIAVRCGFGSASYFMDLFRRQVGMTTGAFRGRIRSDPLSIPRAGRPRTKRGAASAAGRKRRRRTIRTSR